MAIGKSANSDVRSEKIVIFNDVPELKTNNLDSSKTLKLI